MSKKNISRSTFSSSIDKLKQKIEENEKNSKALFLKAEESLKQKTSTENKLASKKLQEESNKLADDIADYRKELNTLQRELTQTDTEINSIESKIEKAEPRVKIIKDRLNDATLTHKTRSDIMENTTNAAINLRKKLEPTKKAAEQMKFLAKQIEKEAKEKLEEYDKKMEIKRKQELDKIDKQYAADQAAESRARQERLAYETKLKAMNIEKTEKTTRDLLVKASKQIDAQRESAAKLEEEIDALVNTFQDTEAFTQHTELTPREAQFLKYYQ